MNKEAELREEQKRLYERLYEIKQELTEMELEGHDFRGKYIYYPGHGYMYVYVQKVDYNESTPKVWFQGVGFDIVSTDYRDECYLSADAMTDWYVRVDTFLRNIDTIKIITREEFEEAFRSQVSKYMKKYTVMLDNIVSQLSPSE